MSFFKNIIDFLKENYLFSIFSGFVIGILINYIASLFSVWRMNRKLIQVKYSESKEYAQIPAPIQDECKLIFKGNLVNGLYENVYLVVNQALDPINSVNLTITARNHAEIFEVNIVDSYLQRKSKAIVNGKEIQISIEYINPLRSLGDTLEIHIFSDRAIPNLDLEGNGVGWKAIYKGQKETKKNEESPLMRSFICIDGPIGVGKTTLAQNLKTKLNGRLILEGFEENPYLADFYANQGKYAFHTQIYFLQARFHQLQTIKTTEYPIISDYFFDKDKIFADLNLVDEDYKTYAKVFDSFKSNLVKPNLLIYLTADPEELMRRISLRARDIENSIRVEYIEKLYDSYETFFNSFTECPILKIDTTKIDLVHNQTEIDKMIEHLQQSIL